MQDIQEVCAICLDVITESKTILDECSHVFCKVCIDKWTDIRSKCPVCKKDLNVVGSKKPSEAKLTQDADEQFDCLDHGYFRVEFKKLQKKLDDTKFLLQQNSKLSRMTDAWSFLEMLALEIGQKLKILTDLEKFNPKELLEDTYRIDKSLKDLGSGNFNSMSFPSYDISEKKVNEDDYYYGEEDYDYDEEYDYYQEEYYDEDEDDDDLYAYGTYRPGPNSKHLKAKSNNNNKKAEAGKEKDKANKARAKC